MNMTRDVYGEGKRKEEMERQGKIAAIYVGMYCMYSVVNEQSYPRKRKRKRKRNSKAGYLPVFQPVLGRSGF